MKYVVHAVADGDLPDGVHQVILDRPGKSPLLIIDETLARCWRFLREWEDMTEEPTVPTVLYPTQVQQLMMLAAG